MRKLLFDKKVVENAEEYFQAIKAGYQPVFLSWKESDRTDELYGYVCAKRGEDDDAAFLYLSMDIGDWELYGWDAEEDKTVDDWDLLQSILDKENPLVWGILGGYLIKHLGDKDLVLEGIAYLQKAVECGNVYAACRLASFYMYHDEWEDVQKAEYYANYALEHGDYGAISVLKRYWLKDGNGEKLVYWLKRAHEGGYLHAATELGDLYSGGRIGDLTQDIFVKYERFVPLDWEEALKWYKIASMDIRKTQANRAYAIFRIAYAMEHGYGCEKDEKGAFMLYKNTAKDTATSAARLGRAYEEGWQVEKDIKKAVYWYQRGNWNVYAQYRLGYFYYYGIHVKQNEKKARQYLSYAISLAHKWEDGYEQARAFLAEINGEKPPVREPAQAPASTPAPMPAPSVTTPEKKAKTEWEVLLERAEKGEINAQLEVAYEYWKGEKVAQSLEKAVYWWTKGAEGNSAEARAFLGACYMEGKGVQKDVSVGLRLIEIAASQGFGNACYMLAIAYEKGDGVERNYDVAYSWYQKALRTELSEGLEKEVWKTLAKYEESRCPSCEAFFAKEGKPTIFGTEYFCRKCGYKY